MNKSKRKIWKTMRVINLFSKIVSGAWGNEAKERETDISCIRVADFDFEQLKVRNGEYTIRSYSNDCIKELKLKKNDILIEKSGGGDKSPVGRAVLFEKDVEALCANFIDVARPNYNTNPKFAEYLLATMYFLGINRFHFNKTIGIQNLNTKSFLREKMNIPNHTEQDKIVEFLDWKTSEINRFINAKKKQIKLLEELKKATITKAVTEGIYSDVEMKESYTYFIHKIPKHWKEIKIKRILQKLTRPFDESSELLICSNHGCVFPRRDKKIGLVSDDDNGYQGVAKGDLLIHGMDTWHGAIAISEFNGKCTGVVHVCESKQDKRYIAYYLKMLAFKKLYKAITNGVRQNTSDFRSWAKAGDIIIDLPPLSEQKEIANYIDCILEKISKQIKNLYSEISLLSEFRTKLISDVITGQIDIQDTIIPDYIKEVENINDEIETINENGEENA